MVNYDCPRCGYFTTHKSHMKNHLNRKNFNKSDMHISGIIYMTGNLTDVFDIIEKIFTDCIMSNTIPHKSSYYTLNDYNKFCKKKYYKILKQYVNYNICKIILNYL